MASNSDDAVAGRKPTTLTEAFDLVSFSPKVLPLELVIAPKDIAAFQRTTKQNNKPPRRHAADVKAPETPRETPRETPTRFPKGPKAHPVFGVLNGWFESRTKDDSSTADTATEPTGGHLSSDKLPLKTPTTTPGNSSLPDVILFDASDDDDKLKDPNDDSKVKLGGGKGRRISGFNKKQRRSVVQKRIKAEMKQRQREARQQAQGQGQAQVHAQPQTIQKRPRQDEEEEDDDDGEYEDSVIILV